ncbi:MAG: preprotein translocase subunit SecA [Deltaproteobacteria bacterium]|nr:preprotein translocase subunit SecA [Deltaproteobacteria bacterium]
MIGWLLQKVLGTKHERELKKMRPLVARINELEPSHQKMTDDELRAQTGRFRERVGNGEPLDALLPEAFATCREAAKRTLNMRHFDVQLIGGMVLHRGAIAEMKTGEGKTLVATLPSYLNALEGKGVHIVTVNDYLATRDAEWMGKIHRFLGLSVGTVVHSQSDREKKAAYRADITYGQNNEYGFDYLRDNMKYSVYDCAQRGLHYAIVDEVDSILIDEARTPLIISGQGEASTHLYTEITRIIPYLRKDEHFVVDEKAHSVQLTDEGVDEAERRLKITNLYDPEYLEQLHVLQQCLRAHTLYKRDTNYLVTEDGKVVIIDEFTGRTLAGRRWSDGLHQAVEAKEYVRVLDENRTMATITFQNLFRLYKKLAGMTGTAETEAEELHKIYKLDVLQIPTNKPVQRSDYDDLVYKTEKEKFKAVVEEIAEGVERGQPALVGTVTVEKSEAISTLLKKRGIKHEVLNAKQHEREAYVVAQAGRKSAVTVATNMAGRGTDIILGGNPEMLARAELILQRKDPTLPENEEELRALAARYAERCAAEREEVLAAGGLHIIGTERHESRRIDNQLRGRAGRQGDPGSSRFYLSLEDDLMRIFAGERVQGIMERLGMEEDVPIEHPWVTRSVENAQQKVEARNFDIRKNVLEYDDVMNQQRKAVYKLRRDVLEGQYTRDPKAEDEERAEGAVWTPDEGTRKRVEELTSAMLRHFPLAKGARGEGGVVGGVPAPRLPAASSLEDMEAFDAERVEMEVYHVFGLRVPLEDLVEAPVKAHERLVEKVLESLGKQRLRLADLVAKVLNAEVEKFCPPNSVRDDWNLESLFLRYKELFGQDPVGTEGIAAREDLSEDLQRQAMALHAEREAQADVELLLRAFRMHILEEIDRAWIDHLTNMDHLRDGIGLRGYGQRDPKLEYKKEGFEMFRAMVTTVNGGVLQRLYRMEFRRPEDVDRLEAEEARRLAERQRRMVLSHIDEDEGLAGALEGLAGGVDPSALEAIRTRAPRSRRNRGGAPASEPPPSSAQAPGGAVAPEGAASEDASAEGERPAAVMDPVRRSGPKVGRNDPCPCGSGKKYKKCHGASSDTQAEGD